MIDLNGLPWFVGILIRSTLCNEKCTPDHVLLLADAIEESAKHLNDDFIYAAPCARVVTALRTLAPEYLKP